MISRGGVPVYIDYAHTPDALEAAIAALRPHVEGRLIIVFGAGGDRDQGKRPEMGAVASVFPTWSSSPTTIRGRRGPGENSRRDYDNGTLPRGGQGLRASYSGPKARLIP